MGDLVEVYEPKINPRYVFNARIVRVTCPHECGDNDDSVTYDVRVGLGAPEYNTFYGQIPSSSATAMKPYDAHSFVM